MSKSRRALAAALAAGILGPVPAHAAGFAIFEQGARGMGFAGAFTAQANDPSAIFHNAAGIAFLKGKQFYGGATLINPTATSTGADPSPGAAVTETGDTGLLVPPAVYYTQPFSERIVFGIGLPTPLRPTPSCGAPGRVTRAVRSHHVVGEPGHVQRTVRLAEGGAQGLLHQSHRRLQAGRPLRPGSGARRAPVVGVAAAPRARRGTLHPARAR